MLRENHIRRTLRDGGVAVGSWITVASPTVAEVMAQTGFDWIAVDMEHGLVGIEAVQTLIQAMGGTSVAPLVRVPWNDHVIIKQVLETGTMGLVIPQVKTAHEAKAAVAASRYPPSGIRGIGCQRPAGYGAWFQQYLQLANEQLLVVIQIEHIDAMVHLEQILAVQGVDVILVGSNDLSASMGFLGQPTHPEVVRVIDRIHAAACAAKVATGIIASSPEDANKRIAEGFKFIGIGHDVGLLSSVCRDTVSRIHWKD
jgi:2-keto-3-deoxy-L-rhamnonate aldolase RhmA